MTAISFAAPRHAVRVPLQAPRSAARAGRGPAVRSHPRAVRRASPRARSDWELRSFLAASAAIGIAFVLALAYLASSTGVAAAGYEAQRLAAQRDELRRQNALLELELARLASPARIEAAAKRLGLVRVSYIPVVQPASLAAQR